MSHQLSSESPFLSTKNLTVHYEDSPVLEDVSMDFNRLEVTALIGPAGSGKTSYLMAMNRLLELNPVGRCQGRVLLNGEDVLNTDFPAEELRRRLSYIGPEPVCFSRSIWDNVAWGPRVNGFTGDQDELVETSLRRAGLWHEVKEMLRKSALRLSGGQRQRLCLARALAVSPDALFLDEPTSRLDPIATGRIEDVLIALKEEVSIVFATHDHLQAGRLAEKTALFLPSTQGYGELVEYARTEELLLNPENKRTEDYITGKHNKGSRYAK